MMTAIDVLTIAEKFNAHIEVIGTNLKITLDKKTPPPENLPKLIQLYKPHILAMNDNQYYSHGVPLLAIEHRLIGAYAHLLKLYQSNLILGGYSPKQANVFTTDWYNHVRRLGLKDFQITELKQGLLNKGVLMHDSTGCFIMLGTGNEATPSQRYLNASSTLIQQPFN